MKRLIVALALLMTLMGVCAMSAMASETVVSGEWGSNLTWQLIKNSEEDYTLKLSGSGAMKSGITMRDLLEEKEFYDTELINALVLPDGLTSIPDNAFAYAVEGYCTLEMPSSVKSIGKNAFEACRFGTVVLHEGLESIGDEAFLWSHSICYPLVIPKSVTSIGEEALDETVMFWVYASTEGERYCKKNGFEYHLIDEQDSAYDARLALARAIGNVEDLPYRYKRLAQQTLPELNLTVSQLETLTAYVNGEREALKQAIYDDGKLDNTEIADFLGRFQQQMSDIGISVSGKLKTINGYPGLALTATVNGQSRIVQFYRTGRPWWWEHYEAPETTTVTEVKLDKQSVTISVGETVTINATVTPAGTNEKPYWGVYGRAVRVLEKTNTSITLQALRPGEADVEIGFGNNGDVMDYSTVYVTPLEKMTSGTIVLPNDTRKIEAEAFAGDACVRVFMPYGVKTIGQGAFRDCKSLRYAWIPPTVTSIASDAFSGCSDVTVFCVEDSTAQKSLENNDNVTFIFMSEYVMEEGDYDW